jgi:hypothetical protein
MKTALLDHVDTAIRDLNNLKDAASNEDLKKELKAEDLNKFLSIFLNKAKQQILMMELYLK